MHHSLLVVLTAAVADASLAIKRDTSSTPAINIASSTGSSPSASSATNDYDPTAKCFPHNDTGNRDFNAPCNLIAAIQAQCTYGPRGLELVTGSLKQQEEAAYKRGDEEWEELSPDAQRVCYCQSQYVDATIGCQSCHLSTFPSNFDVSQGVKGYDSWQDMVRGLQEQYCDVDHKPEKTFMEWFSDASEDAIDEDYESQLASASISGSPSNSTSTSINTSTDVSLYYTLSVEGSSAYSLAMPTPESSGGQITYTTSSTSDGQIVPTTAAAQESSGDDDEATGTSSADSGAATVYAGSVGALAMFGLVAAL